MYISASTVVELPQQASWEKLKDLSVAHYYVPGVVDSRMVSEIKEGVGASRIVYQSAEQHMEETVVDWREGKSILLKLHNETFFLPFQNGQFKYEIEADGSGNKTELTGTLSFQPPLGMLGQWAFKYLIANSLTENVQGTVDGLKYFYETGNAVSKEKS